MVRTINFVKVSAVEVGYVDGKLTEKALTPILYEGRKRTVASLEKEFMSREEYNGGKILIKDYEEFTKKFEMDLKTFIDLATEITE